jgi:hypothetical protein
MITEAHTIVHAEDAQRARASFRDVLGWPHVDVPGDWLIFRLPPGELAVHPAAAASCGILRSGSGQALVACPANESGRTSCSTRKSQ